MIFTNIDSPPPPVRANAACASNRLLFGFNLECAAVCAANVKAGARAPLSDHLRIPERAAVAHARQALCLIDPRTQCDALPHVHGVVGRRRMQSLAVAMNEDAAGDILVHRSRKTL